MPLPLCLGQWIFALSHEKSTILPINYTRCSVNKVLVDYCPFHPAWCGKVPNGVILGMYTSKLTPN